MTKGKHNPKTLAFVKACIAYCHITIPTLESPEQQLRTFHLASRTAMLNGLASETDSLIKAILTKISEIYKEKKTPENDLKLAEEFNMIMGHLVIVPSNPEGYAF